VSALLEVDELRVRLPTRSGPALVVNGMQLSASIASPSITAIMEGVQSHTAVAELWPTWR